MHPFAAALAAELIVIVGIFLFAGITVNGHSIVVVILGWLP